MSAFDIAHALGAAQREGKGWRCRCPLHGGRSLVIRDGASGCLLVTCWGGCDRRDVLAELRWLGLLGGHYAEYRSLAVSQQRQNDDVQRIAWAQAKWESAQDASRSPVEAYLKSRGIYLPMPPALRWTARCWHGASRTHLPAMVACVEHHERGFVGIHRTYLTPENRRRDRAFLGPIGGGAVRLGAVRAGEWLALAEGVETALSITESCGMPAWAALSAGGIRTVVLPPEATMVLICADNDANGVGQGAARDAADRFLAEGRRVRVATPPDPDTDVNDLLVGCTSNPFEKEHSNAAA
jgi:putative DNA primase/helicase